MSKLFPWIKIVFLALVVALPFVLLLNSAHATQIDWPTSPLTGQSLTTESEFHELIAYLYGWGIGVGGLLVFFILIYAGFEYMTSVGDSSKMKNSIQRMTSAGVGLVLLLSSWLILNTINPQITSLSPLPSLWNMEIMDEPLGLGMEDIKEPACEFVLFYTERNYGGSEVERGVGTYETNFEFQSMKSFRRMTENERERYEESGGNYLDGNEVQAGRYIEGSSCFVSIYEGEREGFLNLGWSPCGSSIGSAQGSVPNIGPLIRGDEEDSSCYIIENVGRHSSTTNQESSVMPGMNENLEAE